jgi:hypothetical protein
MFYQALASYVKSANCVEADVHLGFDISIRKSLLLRGLNLQSFDTEAAREKAKHCLIVLVGSKKVWVRVGEMAQGFHVADMFIGSIKFSPVGYETIDGQLTMDVAAFMKWLQKDGLDHKKVLGAINGQAQTPRVS